MRPVSSWGRLSADPHQVIELTDRDRVAAEMLRAGGTGIAHGLGKSYGDASLNPQGILWSTRGLDRLIAFDAATGRLACEAGVVLRDIQRLMMPRGWSLPVVPGTQLVTVGGAIANDVHGKNHHLVGTFGEHVCRLRLVRSDGAWSSAEAKSHWFAGHEGWKAQLRELDFRVGGREQVIGRKGSGAVSRFDARYHEIVPNERIVYVYDMYLDEVPISVSLATIEFNELTRGSQLVITEQGVFLDSYQDARGREHGTNLLMDQLEQALQRSIN